MEALKDKKLCVVEGCLKDNSKGGKGYCAMHWQRLKRYGDLNYITPEIVRRKNNRAAQLRRVTKVKETSYRKFLGRHEHRVVAEQMLGRKLKRGEIVHHKDGNKHNNDPSNLEVLTQSQHILEHFPELYEARMKKPYGNKA